MKTEIDARGLACPEPVIRTKDAMAAADSIDILVDNKTAVENLERLASHHGWSAAAESSGDYYRVMMNRKAHSPSEQSGDAAETRSDTGRFITVLASDEMGGGDSSLGEILMKAFIHTLSTAEDVPSKVLFYNSGVKLAAAGSDVLDDLSLLEEKGSELLICGTCLNFYGLTGELKAGKVSNMYDILESMKKARVVIRP